MNKLFPFVLLAAMVLNTNCQKESYKAKTPTNIYLFGSSFTGYYHFYLPQMATASDDSINKKATVIGGGTLKKQVEKESTLYHIRNSDWDYVMMQESGHNASLHDSLFMERTLPYAKILIDSIRYHNPNARIGLYMTHAYENGNYSMCEFDTTICTFTGMQNRIIRHYIQMSKKFNIELAPVGYYWLKFNELYPDIDLFTYDQVHQSLIGGYLTACIVYITIYNKSPLGIPAYHNITESDTRLVQEFVDKYVLNDQAWISFYNSIE